MLRKRIVKVLPSLSVPEPGEMDIAATAAVQVTSEDPTHPIEHVFDNRRGPGEAVGLQQSRVSKRCCWRSIPPDHSPDHCGSRGTEVSRTQELQLSVSHDGGQTYRELRRQEYNFSPPGTTFERENWAVLAEGVTPATVDEAGQGGKPCRATLTALVLKRAER